MTTTEEVHRPHPSLGLLALLAVLVAGASSWAGAKVATVSGEVVEAEQVTFEAGGGVVVEGPAGQRRLEPGQLVAVEFGPPLAPGGSRARVLLTTGETLTGALRELSTNSATVHSRLLGELQLARGEVGGAVFTEGVSLADLLASPAGLVVLRNGDRIQGQVESVRSGVATLVTALGKLDVSLDRVAFIKNAELPPSWSRVERPCAALALADGDRLLGEVLGEADGKVRFHRLSAPTGAGTAGAPEATRPAELAFPKSEVREVRYLGEGVVYLSDLEPAQVEEKPFFNYLLAWQRDLSVGKARLTLRGQMFDKGLGVHARCLLSYALGGNYARFHSLVGIDDETQGKGNCVFEVRADGKQLFASGPVTGQEAPRPVDLDVRGAKELVLLVDFGEGGDVGDRADWADAYLVTAEALTGTQSQGKGTP